MKRIVPDLWQTFLYQSGILSKDANHAKSITKKDGSILVQEVIREHKIECSELEKNLLNCMQFNIHSEAGHLNGQS